METQTLFVLVDFFVGACLSTFGLEPFRGLDAGALFLWYLVRLQIFIVCVHAVFVFRTRRESAQRQAARKMGFLVGLTGAGLVTCQQYFNIKSHFYLNAALELASLPLFFVYLVLTNYYTGWGVGLWWHEYSQRAGRAKSILYGFGALYVSLAAVGVYAAQDLYREARLIQDIEHMSSAELHSVAIDPGQRERKWVLNALACNPNLSREDLFVIASLPDPSLHVAAAPRFVSNACNKRGLAIMRLVIMHPNVGLDSLEALSHSSDHYVIGDLLDTDKTPETLKTFIKESQEPGVQRAAQQWLEEHPQKNRDTASDESSVLQAQRASADPDAGLTKHQRDTHTDATGTGCSAGPRAALLDAHAYPNIAACVASWPRTSMRAPATGTVCGRDAQCNVPADACDRGWHVCGTGLGGVDELRKQLTAAQCAALGSGRFLVALSDTDCDGCGTGGGHGAVCCGRGCVQQRGSCVYPNATAWAGVMDEHVNACGDAEMGKGTQDGVLCCREPQHEATE